MRLASLGAVLMVAGFALAFIGAPGITYSTIQPALPSTISGTEVIQLPPCNSQSVNNCVLSESWTATLVPPAQASALYGGGNACGLIALWATTFTSASYLPVPTWGGGQMYQMMGGVQYMSTSIPGYPGTGSTPYVHYSSADGCLGSSATTTSQNVQPATTSTTVSTTSITSMMGTIQTSSSVVEVSSTAVTTASSPGPSGNASPQFPLLFIVGLIVAASGLFVTLQGEKKLHV
jgi:hypothetical protein